MAGINLKVQIEINGQFVQAGHITGSSFRDAAFSYDESYITSPVARAISLSLPLSKKAFDTDGTVTLYEYDIKGQLSTVYYPYTKAMEVALKEEAEENKMPTVGECGINKYLDTGTRNSLSALLNRISWNYGSKILAMQLFIKDSYKYDGNGNRIQKITPYGTIDYTYNEENLLVSSGWNGNTGIIYTYDKEGNLLTQESELKIIKYAYNAQNRIMYSEVTDKKEKTHSVSYYGYDAFGRRVIEQDKDEAALRSLYDGFTFDVIKQSPTFANGLFVDSYETGIRINITGKPTGDRYRYLEDTPQQDGNRYFHLDEGNYRNVSSRYKGSRTTLSVNGIIAGQNADGDISYFTTDLLGSVRSTTDGYGYVDKTYSYDAFGAIIEGDLSGKQFDKQTGLYNYGYRDYTPKLVRFTTVDPIRDGENWLTYCKNDSVNHVDLWGLESNDKTKDNKFLGVLSELKTSINQLINVDSGADYKYLSENSWKQGKYLQSVIYNIDGLIESAIDVALAPTSAVTSKIDSFCQNNLGLGLDEMAITLQANGLTAVAGQTLYYATQWAKLTAAMSGSKTVITATNIGCDIVTQGTSFVGVDNNIIQVTNEGVALFPGIKIPKNLIENPYRSGSYGVILDGKFKETLRIDPPTPTGKKGPEYSHFYINGDKEHLTDISK